MLAVAPLTDLVDWARGAGLEIVLCVLGAVLAVRFVGWARDRTTARIDAANDDDGLVRSEATKYRHSLAQALSWVCAVVIWAVAVALVLDRLGIPFSSLVAPVTVVGAAIGIGSQQLVRDLIGGVFIITERQYGFGDVVRISGTTKTDGTTGTVEDVTLRVTRLRTPNGEVVIIPNGEVQQVTNLSSEWARAVVDIPLPVGADVARAERVLRDIGSALAADDDLEPLLLDEPTVMGVQSFDGDTVTLRIVARTLPGKQFAVERALRARIATTFPREGIVPTADAPATSADGDDG